VFGVMRLPLHLSLRKQFQHLLSSLSIVHFLLPVIRLQSSTIACPMVVRIISKPKITISAGLRNIKLMMKKTKKIINKTFIPHRLSFPLSSFPLGTRVGRKQYILYRLSP
jgi:hypothetical protein